MRDALRSRDDLHRGRLEGAGEAKVRIAVDVPWSLAGSGLQRGLRRTTGISRGVFFWYAS